MNDVKELVQQYNSESVWFYLPKNKTKEIFKKDLLEMQVQWADGSLFGINDHISDFMAVHKDMTIAYVSGFIWSQSFNTDIWSSKKVIKIDYQKYIDGCTDYLITHLNITYVNFE